MVDRAWLWRAFGAGAVCVSAICYTCLGEPRVNGEQYLKERGWDIVFIESEKIKIPARFDEVYISYNAMQKESGFDLEPYAGKECMRYTYEVKNFPDYAYGVRANVLVYGAEVIGGDICTVGLGGFMMGLCERE